MKAGWLAGDNSAMERAAKAREKAGELKRLLDELVHPPPAISRGTFPASILLGCGWSVVEEATKNLARQMCRK